MGKISEVKTTRLSREEFAAIEIGQTAVSKQIAVVFSAFFLLFVFTIPVAQVLLDLRGNKPTIFSQILNFSQTVKRQVIAPYDLSFTEKVNAVNNTMLDNMDRLETDREKSSFLRDIVLAPGQKTLLTMLGVGNEKVYPGTTGWLFYRPDIDHVVGPGFLTDHFQTKRKQEHALWEMPRQPNPIDGIVDFNKQLALYDVELLLVPVPVKPSILPERFYSGFSNNSPLLKNSSWPDFIARLKAEGIPVFDPGPLLNGRFSTAAYLSTDTHWRAQAMEKVAKELALFIDDNYQFDGEGSPPMKRQKELVGNRGDIDAMLLLPQKWQSFELEEVSLHKVYTGSDELWRSSPQAEVLLLGDSFTNIFSLAGMGWGEGSGFGEQLSFYLNKPLDVIVQNDGGSYATRELLAADLARGRDRLANKKLVIWQFAARELSQGDWRIIPLKLNTEYVSEFYTVPGGQKVRVKAHVAEISPSPRPGSVPYKDNIVTLHLVDVVDVTSDDSLGEALVYAWGMKDNEITELANVRNGDTIELTLTSWDDVEGLYSSYRRSTLENEFVEFELPNWGEFDQ